MIEVLNRDIEGQKFYIQKCTECHAELKFAFDDTYIGAYGVRYLKCPVCGEEIITGIDGIDLTYDNVEFPIHFYKTGEEAVDIPDEQIQKWVRRGLSAFKNGEARDFWYSGTGNAFMIILAMEDEYCIYVMKNYWECEIPKDNMNKM